MKRPRFKIDGRYGRIRSKQPDVLLSLKLSGKTKVKRCERIRASRVARGLPVAGTLDAQPTEWIEANCGVELEPWQRRLLDDQTPNN